MEPLSPPQPGVPMSVSPPPGAVWLDHLPSQVCSHIARFIKHHSFQSVYNFAHVSSALHAAVSSAFDDVLDLEYVEAQCQRSYEYTWDSGVSPTWLETDCCALVGYDVREVRLSGSLLYPVGVRQAFKSPSLTKLVISERPCEFDYLRHVSNLRCLEMTRQNFSKLKMFLKCMSIPILDLHKLVLHTGTAKCLHDDFTDDVANHSLLASWFPRVENLYLRCCKCDNSDNPSTSYLWSAIERFPQLREVTLTEHVPEHAIERLRAMERVTIADGNHLTNRDPLALAEAICTQVVALTRPPLKYPSYGQLQKDYDMFDRLARCTQLEHFSCTIPRGAEKGLVKIAANLRSLRLAFQQYPGVDDVHRDEDWVDMNTDAVLEALRAAPHLSKLVFMPSAPIRAQELCEMLTVLGGRLEHFCASIFPWCSGDIADDAGVMKQELRDVLLVLRTVAIHNPSLTSFELGWRFEGLDVNDRIHGLAEIAILPVLPEFRATCSVLQRRAPRLDTLRLKRMLRRLMAFCSQPISSSDESDWSE